MPNNNDYPYIRAWCKMMGSFDYWLQDQLEQARADNAPQNATYRRDDGTWSTTDNITNPDTRTQLGLPPLGQMTVQDVISELGNKVCEGEDKKASSIEGDAKYIYSFAQVHCYQQAQMFLVRYRNDPDVRSAIERAFELVDRMRSIQQEGLNRFQNINPTSRVNPPDDFAYVQACLNHYNSIMITLQVCASKL